MPLVAVGVRGGVAAAETEADHASTTDDSSIFIDPLGRLVEK